VEPRGEGVLIVQERRSGTFRPAGRPPSGDGITSTRASLGRMLQSRRWGRPTLAWAIDAGVVVLALALLLLGSGTVQLLGVLLLVWRVATVALAVVVWRRTAEGRSRS
jgi:hypothetical protein